ncbi:hypothetical protein ACL6C3_09810 [Capilliphycus salinus ALCB114379]|uniref:hypothetical protein n=1 Tax=Capilliphycus salinus TaxID=2768948 RepID=UPI0039A4AF42
MGNSNAPTTEPLDNREIHPWGSRCLKSGDDLFITPESRSRFVAASALTLLLSESIPSP